MSIGRVQDHIIHQSDPHPYRTGSRMTPPRSGMRPPRSGMRAPAEPQLSPLSGLVKSDRSRPQGLCQDPGWDGAEHGSSDFPSTEFDHTRGTPVALGLAWAESGALFLCFSPRPRVGFPRDPEWAPSRAMGGDSSGEHPAFAMTTLVGPAGDRQIICPLADWVGVEPTATPTQHWPNLTHMSRRNEHGLGARNEQHIVGGAKGAIAGS